MVYDIFYVSKNIIDSNDWNQFRLRFPSSQKIENVTTFNDIKKKSFTKFAPIMASPVTIPKYLTTFFPSMLLVVVTIIIFVF